MVKKTRRRVNHENIPYPKDPNYVKSLVEAIDIVKPTAIIGAVPQVRQFTKDNQKIKK